MGLALVPVLLSFAITSRNKTTQFAKDQDAPSAILAFWSLMLIAFADLVISLYQSLGPGIGIAFQFSTRLYNFASFPTLIVFLSAYFSNA
jgi:hypothetical protein